MLLCGAENITGNILYAVINSYRKTYTLLTQSELKSLRKISMRPLCFHPGFYRHLTTAGATENAGVENAGADRGSASEMTYIVSGGALNSTHSLTQGWKMQEW